MNRFLKKTLAVLIAFVALVAALEILYRLLKVPKITHQNIHAKAQTLMPRINNNTILIIGDSRLEWGMKPQTVLEKFKAAGFSGNVVDMAMPGSNGLDVMQYLIANNIQPKLIIHGYAPNYSSYNNHGFDKEDYTAYNKISENFSYWLDQHLYFRDPSVLNWLKRAPLYFKKHTYDSLGGALVEEYGDYNFRASSQYDMFKSFKNNFTRASWLQYCHTADSAIGVLKKRGSIVYGLAMPVSKKIHSLLNDVNSDTAGITSYNKFYDFSFFTYTSEAPAHDSTYFLDGCHLLPVYAIVFTGKVADSLMKDFMKQNK